MSGSFGWGLGYGIRIEAQTDWAQNSISKLNGVNRAGFGASTSNASGSEVICGAMFNAIYDFVGYVPVVVPYAGIGVGYQRAHPSNFSVSGIGNAAAHVDVREPQNRRVEIIMH